MTSAWRCWLTGRHKWDQDIEAIPDSSLFHRVDCLRCDRAVDGAMLKRLAAELSPSARRRLL